MQNPLKHLHWDHSFVEIHEGKWWNQRHYPNTGLYQYQTVSDCTSDPCLLKLMWSSSVCCPLFHMFSCFLNLQQPHLWGFKLKNKSAERQEVRFHGRKCCTGSFTHHAWVQYTAGGCSTFQMFECVCGRQRVCVGISISGLISVYNYMQMTTYLFTLSNNFYI